MKGFILLPVALALALTATVAYLMSREAGTDTRVTASNKRIDSARYAAEAGLQHAAWLAQTKNCVNYPDVASTSLAQADNGVSYSATLDRTSGSPVLITAIGVLADGTRHTFSRNVEIYPTAQRQMILPAAEDTYINAADTGKNYGGSSTLRLHQGSVNALLRFDLTPIASHAQIVSTQLELRQYNTSSSTGATVSAHKLVNQWNEGTGDNSSTLSGATWTLGKFPPSRLWAVPGGDADTRVSATRSVTTANAWFAWDITDVTRDWLPRPANNYGVLLKPSAPLSNADFRSSEASQTTERPKLTVAYRLPCGATTSNPPMVADTYINLHDRDKNFGAKTELELGDQDHIRVLMRFDTSSIAAGTRVNSAILRFYVSSVSNDSNSRVNLRAHSLTQPWTQGNDNNNSGATWKKRTPTVDWIGDGAEGDYAAIPHSVMNIDTASFSNGWLEFDLTTLAQNWVDNSAQNHGVILLGEASGPDDELKLNSKENSTNRPQLVVAY